MKTVGDATGKVFGIQRFSVDDGPGIRTAVFLKGCPLRCLWCHNPEGLSPEPILSYSASRCVDCGECVAACSRGVHQVVSGKHRVIRDRCNHCGDCVAVCVGQALEIVGKAMTVGEVMTQVERDRKYYQNEGGLTLSGGEPMWQFPFAMALAKECQSQGIRTAMETAGIGRLEDYLQILPLIDVFLWDFKESDEGRHREFTGVGNKEILANARAIGEAGGKIILRCPVIPGLNDREDHFTAIRRFANSCRGIVDVQIMPYHKLGSSKAARFGSEAGPLYEQPNDDTLAEWQKAILSKVI